MENTMNAVHEPLLSLRVLSEYDKQFSVHVARCLETGHVVTADDANTAIDMMRELLEDEINFAIEHQNLPNLLSTPASFDVWVRWRRAVAGQKRKPEMILLNIDARELRLDNEPEVSTELRITSAN
jgi:hypothetical protein